MFLMNKNKYKRFYKFNINFFNNSIKIKAILIIINCFINII